MTHQKLHDVWKCVMWLKHRSFFVWNTIMSSVAIRLLRIIHFEIRGRKQEV